MLVSELAVCVGALVDVVVGGEGTALLVVAETAFELLKAAC
jgi:hypothetical protein